MSRDCNNNYNKISNFRNSNVLLKFPRIIGD